MKKIAKILCRIIALPIVLVGKVGITCWETFEFFVIGITKDIFNWFKNYFKV